MKNLTLSCLACLSLLTTASAFAASEPASRFDPQQTFAPFVYPQPANAMRMKALASPAHGEGKGEPHTMLQICRSTRNAHAQVQ